MSEADLPELDRQLLAACRAEPASTATIRELLERGANPRAASYHRHILYGDVMTGLHALGLCRDNPVEAAQLLLDAGADIEARGERRCWTPLFAACSWNHTPMVRLLLERGAAVDVVSTDYGATTPLSACINANAELCLPTVELLLAAGADPNLRSENGDSPLYVAVEAENLEVVEALLAAGAEPNGAQRRDPILHRAVLSRDTGPIIDALIAAGADVHARAGGGRAVIHEALLRSQLVHLDRLLGAGALLDARDDEGLTPLMTWLSWHARPTPMAVLDALVARGVDLHAVDDAGTPTLHYALRKGEAAVVRALVAAGADPDQRDAAGQSALELARELNPMLVVALGRGGAEALAPPTELALQGLRAGLELVCVGGRLRGDTWVPEIGRPQARAQALIREQLAWSLIHGHVDAAAIAAHINAVAAELGHEPRATAALIADLREREAELVARCELELRPEHGPQILEAAVRAGYQPVRSDKEGFWVWRFVGGPEDQAFEFKEAGDHLPEGQTRRTGGAELREFFASFSVERGHLDGWQRHRLDAALKQLGHASERQWLQALVSGEAGRYHQPATGHD